MASLLVEVRSLDEHRRISGGPAKRIQEQPEFGEGGDRELRHIDQVQRRAALLGSHPLRHECPGTVRQQTDEVVVGGRAFPTTRRQ